MTLGAKFGDCLEEVTQALHRDVGTGSSDESARNALNVGDGLEQFLINANRDNVESIEWDILIGMNVGKRVLRHRDDPGHT